MHLAPVPSTVGAEINAKNNENRITLCFLSSSQRPAAVSVPPRVSVSKNALFPSKKMICA